MSPAVRTLHVPGAKALESIRVRAQAVLVEWAREWMSGWQENTSRIELQVAALDVASGPTAAEYVAVRSASGCLWYRRDWADRAAFARCVVGPALMQRSACADDWVIGVVERAWQTLTHALCAELLGPPVAPGEETVAVELPESLFAFGSGAVQLSCEALGLFAIADRAVWRTVPPSERAVTARPALTPVDHAARRAAVRLDVMLGSVEVELPKVLDLRGGDILRLPQRLDQPLTVVCAGKPLARAVLGEIDGCRGVQLVTDPP
jgi:hypothetical protein